MERLAAIVVVEVHGAVGAEEEEQRVVGADGELCGWDHGCGDRGLSLVERGVRLISAVGGRAVGRWLLGADVDAGFEAAAGVVALECVDSEPDRSAVVAGVHGGGWDLGRGDDEVTA